MESYMKKIKFLPTLLLILLFACFTSACNFEVSVSPSKVSVEKPSNMAFNNILIQKTAGKELKELKEAVENYLTKIDAGEDEYVYKNLLHPAFHEQYTLDEIASMNNKIRRTMGKYESCDFDKAEISIKRDSLSKDYKIVLPVKYANGTERVELNYSSKDNVLKIIKFNFKPI